MIAYNFGLIGDPNIGSIGRGWVAGFGVDNYPQTVWGRARAERILNQYNKEHPDNPVELRPVEIAPPIIYNPNRGLMHPEYEIVIDRNCIPWGVQGRKNVAMASLPVTNVKVEAPYANPQRLNILTLYYETYGEHYNGVIEINGGSWAGHTVIVGNGKILSTSWKD